MRPPAAAVALVLFLLCHSSLGKNIFCKHCQLKVRSYADQVVTSPMHVRLSISLFYESRVFSSKVLRHIRNGHWRNTSLFGFSQTRGVFFWWKVWKGVSSRWTMSHSHFRRCGHWCDLHQLQNSHAEILQWSELITKWFLLSLSKWYINFSIRLQFCTKYDDYAGGNEGGQLGRCQEFLFNTVSDDSFTEICRQVDQCQVCFRVLFFVLAPRHASDPILSSVRSLFSFTQSVDPWVLNLRSKVRLAKLVSG